MKYDSEIGNHIATLLEERFNSLPKGKPWIKYGKNRLYFNDKKDGVDYGFYIQFDTNTFEIGDFMEEYWLDKLGVESIDEFRNEVEDIYYNAAYPPDTVFPSTTVREIRQHRRFEATVLDETSNKISLNPVSFDIEISLDKDDIDEIVKTQRTFGGEPIVRIVIMRNKLEAVSDYIEKLEDEADMLFMQQMQQRVGQNIQVSDESDLKQDITIEKGQERTCINCHKKFITSSTGPQTEFCSTDCVKEYQLTQE